VLLIQRAVRPGDPGSGHVALPGGRADPLDASLRTTALRELEEEVGLGLTDLEGPPRFLGIYSAHAFGLEVAIFAGLLRPSARRARAVDPHEVEEVFWMPVEAVHRPAMTRRKTTQGDRSVPAVQHDGHVLWGFTLRVLGELLSRIEGESPSRELARPPQSSDEADPKL
jgi:8-oxo-dGTP pyrophosphatase MutT (NUDIX family)